VTGVGFIGGGIIFQEEDRVVDRTTASAVWVTTALRMSIGAGLFDLTTVSFLLLAFSLVAMVPVERFINLRKQRRSYRIMSLYQQKTLKRYDELFRQYGMSVKKGKQSRTGEVISGNLGLAGIRKTTQKAN
jgi:putative Mg2+ transporter-C (MgtC) family protein